MTPRRSVALAGLVLALMVALGAVALVRPADRAQVAVTGDDGEPAADAVTSTTTSLSTTSTTDPPVTSTTEPPATSTTAPPPSDRPTEIVALRAAEYDQYASDGVVVLDAATGEELRVLFDLEEHLAGTSRSGTPPTSISDLVVDGSGTVWFVVNGTACGEDAIYRVPVDGSAPPELVLTGLSPAPSPDGRRLAYSRSTGPSVSCAEDIVVLDLESGAEQVFAAPAEPPLPVVVREMAWAPDGRRLAITEGWEHRRVVVLDTTTAQSQTGAVPIPWGEGDYPGCTGSPVWVTGGELLVVGLVSEYFCGGENGVPDEVARFALEADGTVVRRDPLPCGGLAADTTGVHLLCVTSEAEVLLLDAAGVPTVLARGYNAADW